MYFSHFLASKYSLTNHDQSGKKHGPRPGADQNISPPTKTKKSNLITLTQLQVTLNASDINQISPPGPVSTLETMPILNPNSNAPKLKGKKQKTYHSTSSSIISDHSVLTSDYELSIINTDSESHISVSHEPISPPFIIKANIWPPVTSKITTTFNDSEITSKFSNNGIQLQTTTVYVYKNI